MLAFLDKLLPLLGIAVLWPLMHEDRHWIWMALAGLIGVALAHSTWRKLKAMRQPLEPVELPEASHIPNEMRGRRKEPSE